MQLDSPAVTLDLSVVGQLREIARVSDPNLFQQLVDLYHHDCARYVATIQESIKQADLTDAKRAAHALKSASSNMGAMMVAENCRLLEQNPATTPNDEIITLAKTIAEEYSSACKALQQLCEVSS